MEQEPDVDLSSLWSLSACEVVDLLKSGNVTPTILIDEVEKRWRNIDPLVNAVPITCFDRARCRAKNFVVPANPPEYFLYGLPVLIKDEELVSGVVCTQGCVLNKDIVASSSSLFVEKLEKSGGIIVGKTNQPGMIYWLRKFPSFLEFAAGSNTFNDLFGATLNPWDVRTSSGGSSGGSAAALASGTFLFLSFPSIAAAHSKACAG
jgi:amidase